MRGLIVENISNTYKVKIENNICNCMARGKLKNGELIPVVGDYVEVEILDKEESKGTIEKILERKSYIKRPKIANIDQIIFVVSMKNPKPDLLLLDKQLAFANFVGVKPLIVLNKIDLDKHQDEVIIEKIYKEIGYTVIKTNAKDGVGLESLKENLKNKISAFSGNSGVGKSTLINKIFDYELTQEGIISAKNNRGKNTTTSIKLYQIDENSYIADTPGFSTFDVNEIPYKDISKYFTEFDEYITKCEYIGCSHIKEKNCGVKEALQNEKISQSRYDNYVKIYKELKDREDHKW